MALRIFLFSDEEALENVQWRVQAFLGPPRNDKPVIHQFYKAKFSAVDRANQAEDVNVTPGRVHNEEGRMIRGLLKIPRTNVNSVIDFITAGSGVQRVDFSDTALAIYIGLIQEGQFPRRYRPKQTTTAQKRKGEPLGKKLPPKKRREQ